MNKNDLPKFNVPKGYTSESYFNELIKKGINKRFGENIFANIQERIDYEVLVINKLNYTNTFLVLWDIINYAKSHNIPVGVGRGSYPSSLVAYVLSISEINPLEYDLLFERFLNSDKLTEPNIQIDICPKKSAKVIDYITQKYGNKYIIKKEESFCFCNIEFLYFETLATIDKTLKLIKKNHNRKLDINNILVYDADTFNMLSDGNTKDVFLLDTELAKKYTKTINPILIEDLSFIIAIYRPQILDLGLSNINIENIINLSENKFPISSIIEETHGCIIYQEQIMQILQIYTGCSLNEADIIRRILCSKDNEEIQKQRLKFIEKSIKNGILKEEAESIFNKIADIAPNCITKSHTISYAYIIYQTAYLKCHYNKEYNKGINKRSLNKKAKLYSSKGIRNFRHGKLEQALKYLSRAVELNSKSYETYCTRALIYDCFNDFENAIADYTKAIEVSPNNYEGYYNRANIYSGQELYDLSIKDYSETIKLKPNYFQAHIYRGKDYCYLKEFEKAKSDFLTALSITKNEQERDYPSAHIPYQHLADLEFIEKHNHKDAIPLYTEAIKIINGYNRTYSEKIHFGGGKVVSEIGNFKNSLGFKSYFHRGLCYFELGNIEQAKQDFTDAIDLALNDSDFNSEYLEELYTARAGAYELLGEEKKSEEDIKMAEKYRQE